MMQSFLLAVEAHQALLEIREDGVVIRTVVC